MPTNFWYCPPMLPYWRWIDRGGNEKNCKNKKWNARGNAPTKISNGKCRPYIVNVLCQVYRTLHFVKDLISRRENFLMLKVEGGNFVSTSKWHTHSLSTRLTGFPRGPTGLNKSVDSKVSAELNSSVSKVSGCSVCVLSDSTVWINKGVTLVFSGMRSGM